MVYNVVIIVTYQVILSSKFQSSMTIFHHELLMIEGRVLANSQTHPSYVTLFAHLFIRSVIQKVTMVTLSATQS